MTNPVLTLLNQEVVIGCNLDCIMCIGGNYRREHGLQFLSVEKLKEILDKIPTLKSFNLIGIGEPLLHPQWSEIMGLLNDRRLALTFTTNATLLNEENIKSIHPTAYIAISIDTLNPEAYKKVRGIELEGVLANVELLRKMKPHAHLFLNVVVIKQTVDDLNLLIPYAKKIRATIHLIHAKTHDQKKHDLFVPTKEQIKARIKEFKRKAYQNNVKYLRVEETPRQWTCIAPLTSLTVKLNGDVYSCCYVSSADYNFERFNNHTIHIPIEQYHIGNIFTDSIEELFHGKKMNHIRNIIQSSTTKNWSNFDELRKNADLDIEHEYCKICLNRWGMVC
jgi:MoaA/NifB/PqqE/SkfB family radical SAM enzyme